MRKSTHGRSLFLVSAAMAALLLAPSCAQDTSRGKPLPPLSFNNLTPLYVEAGQIEVVMEYDQNRDPQDVAQSLPTPPVTALRDYAHNRLRAGAYEGVLRFVIEDAAVRTSLVPPESRMLDMIKMGASDQYDANVRVRLFRVSPDGRESSHGIIRLQRFVTIPQHYSLAQREQELQNFVAEIMAELDRSVSTTLREQVNAMAPASLGAHYGGR